MPEYKLTMRNKRGEIVAETSHPTNDDAYRSLTQLGVEMHYRPEAKNTGVFDTAHRGWLWATDAKEASIAGTYVIEEVADA